MDKDIDETETSDEMIISDSDESKKDETETGKEEGLWSYFTQPDKLNPVFKQQQEAARNLNALRLKAYNENHDKFKEKTNDLVRSVGIKAIKDTNPDLAEAIEEAQTIDNYFIPNRADDISKAKDNIINLVSWVQSPGKNSGWNKKAKAIKNDLELIGISDSLKTLEDYKGRNLNELTELLNVKANAAKKIGESTKARRTELQEQIDSYKPDTFKTSKQVAIDKYDEFFAHAEPTLTAFKELITNYSKFLTPEVITELEGEVEQIKDYINDARDKGVKAGEIKKYYELVNKVRENVRNNYQDILNKLNAYSNSVSAEDALISEIKSLASYEQYSQLPPEIFEKLPDDIKNKVIRLMELKAKLQKQQGKTKSISQKYKLNVDNKPISVDKDSRKVINPALFRGYKLFENVKLHQTFY